MSSYENLLCSEENAMLQRIFHGSLAVRFQALLINLSVSFGRLKPFQSVFILCGCIFYFSVHIPKQYQLNSCVFLKFLTLQSNL